MPVRAGLDRGGRGRAARPGRVAALPAPSGALRERERGEGRRAPPRRRGGGFEKRKKEKKRKRGRRKERGRWGAAPPPKRVHRSKAVGRGLARFLHQRLPAVAKRMKNPCTPPRGGGGLGNDFFLPRHRSKKKKKDRRGRERGAKERGASPRARRASAAPASPPNPSPPQLEAAAPQPRSSGSEASWPTGG